ncbi:MAG: adenosylcobinamide-GDP ribazoletransferase [Actinophytocola sp.]|nr:adenosylcobinamide-GDP ribazoletransferase [Actinophytocola sp.]
MMRDALRLAVGTLTAVPVPPPRQVDSDVARRAMLLAPLATLPLAALACAVVLLGDVVGLPPLLTAALAVGSVALGTRGMHLDGLADTADGLGASYDRERALDVMRTGDVGPMGAATLVLVLLGQVAALAGAIAAGHGVFAAAVGVLAGRLVLGVCCLRMVPAARPGGLGAAVAGSTPMWQVALALTHGAVVAALGAMLADVAPWQGVLAVLLALLASGALLWRCVRRLGGITGDVLGACVEAATLGALVALAA